ncbi:5,6-dimethylbenzimidazole synthase [Sphingomonas sp. H160509]|uniref:5,6-dimethylbenzimidazole synthase n=1 Tax=Sphingomonas sp. H160509 TaxID=2955313 RepID=UPI0031586256
MKLAGLERAPCHVAVFVEPDPDQGHGLGRRTMPEAVAYSAVIAVHTLWLAARAQGVGLGWVSILDPSHIRTILDVPETWHLVAYLCVGYPEIEAIAPELEREGWEKRRSINIVVR